MISLKLTSAGLEQHRGLGAGQLDDGEDVDRGFEFCLLENQDFAGLGTDENMPGNGQYFIGAV